MNCNELREHYELYAIGVAEEPERSEIRVHLNRQCEVCMEGMRRARETAALLGGAATPAALRRNCGGAFLPPPGTNGAASAGSPGSRARSPFR